MMTSLVSSQSTTSILACGKKQKTAVVSSSVNPRWNESFDFIVHDVWHSSVSIELFDDDGKFNADDELGRLVGLKLLI